MIVNKMRNPYEHQSESIGKSQKYYRINDRGYIILPCGTGKTYTAILIARKLKSGRIILAVPNITLQSQALRDWIYEIKASGKEEYNILCISSDKTVTSGIPYEKELLSTTDPIEIASFLSRNKKVIVITTYQSGEILGEVSRKAKISYDFGIYDEAHRTVGEMDKQFAHMVFDGNIKIKKRLFMTASFKVYAGKENVVSMDKEEIYGKEIYSMSWKEAIKKKLICDYKIAPILCTEKDILEFEKSNPNIMDLKHGLSGQESFLMVSAAISVLKCVKKHGLKRIVSYHSTRKKAKLFMGLVYKMAPLFKVKIDTYYVDGKMSSNQRNDILEQFIDSENPAILTNSKALVEGINIPAIDGIAFVDKKSSTVDIMQAVGRATRNYLNKKFAVIILPTFIKSIKNEEDIINSKGFGRIKETLLALASFDDNIRTQYSTNISSLNGRMDWGSVGEENTVDFDISDLSRKTKTILSESIVSIYMDYMSLKEFREFLERRNITSIKAYKELHGKGNIINGKKIPSSPSSFYREAIFRIATKFFYKKKYRTSKELEEFSPDGVCARTIYSRCTYGWSVKDAVETPLQEVTKFGLDGELLTARQIANKKGCVVNHKILENRMKKGWNLEEAMTTPVRGRREKYEGKKYDLNGKDITIYEASKMENCVVDTKTIHARLKRGWDLEKAMVTPVRKPNKILVDGRELPLSEIPKKIKRCIVSFSVLKGRLDYGWDLEKAMITPPRSKDKFLLDGVEYSIPELVKLERCVVSKNTVRRRLDNGWSVKDAVETPTRTN